MGSYSSYSTTPLTPLTLPLLLLLLLYHSSYPSTYQELYPASTLNLIASDDNETRRCSSPQIEREATTVSDQSTVPSSVQEHQNDEGQGEERDEHVPNPSVHRQYLPTTITDVHGKQLTTVLTQLIKSKPTVEDVKPKPVADRLEGDQLLPGDHLMSGYQPSPGEGYQLLPEEQLSTAHQQIPGTQEGCQLLSEEQLSTAHQQIPGKQEGYQLLPEE